MKKKSVEKFMAVYPSEPPFELGGTEIFILSRNQIKRDFVVEGRRPLSVHKIGEKIALDFLK